MGNHSTARVALLTLHGRKLGLNACGMITINNRELTSYQVTGAWLECVRDEFTINNGEFRSYQVR